jgi:hypothetical protein
LYLAHVQGETFCERVPYLQLGLHYQDAPSASLTRLAVEPMDPVYPNQPVHSDPPAFSHLGQTTRFLSATLRARRFTPSSCGGQDLTPQTDVELGNFHNFEGRDLVPGLDQKLAALFGTTYDKIVVNDIVVHQPSQQIFISVERGRGTDATPAIVKVDHGNLEVLDLDDIPHSQAAIANEPDAAAMLEFEPQSTYAITDVKYYNGEIFVTGISNQRFASTLYRIPYPFNARMATCTVEIWHPVHGEFETRAPIIRQLIREVNGEPYLFAVYGCTPLVRFPLDSLKDGAHVRGDTIGELGYGSNPLDMLTFSDPFDRKEYLLVTIDARSASRIAVADLGSAQPGPTGGPIDFGPGGLGRTQRALPIRAEHMAILDPKWAVVIWRHPKTSFRLDVSTLAMPYFFERRDGMSEMNWPNGPDPFDYRNHRNEIDRVDHLLPV